MKVFQSGEENKRRLLPLLVLLVSILLLSFTGFTAARYVLQQQRDGVAAAQNFYFTSDLLKDESENASYYIDPKAANFTVHLYNFADSKRTTAKTIRYAITTDNAAITDSASGSLTGNNQNTGTITITPNEGASTVTITVTSSPYKKVLKATFTLALGNRYTVEDASGNTAAVLTMTCTDDAKNIPLTLPSGVIPDATDTRVTLPADGEYLFTSPGEGVYSLVLLKSTPAVSLSRTETAFADTINITIE